MDEADKKQFSGILPELVKRLNPKEILPYLACLSGPSREVIINRQNNESTLSAMLALQEHLCRCVKGFQELVFGLQELGLNDIADRLTRGKDGYIKHEKLDKTSGCRKRRYNHDTFVRDINVGFVDILRQLDFSGEERWQQLAGHLGCSYRDCSRIANEAKMNEKSPTSVLLDHNIDLTLGKLLTILKYNMERTDIVEMLEKFTGYRLPNIHNEKGDDDWQRDEIREHENDVIQADKRSISERQDKGVEILYNRKHQQKQAINKWTNMVDSKRNENVMQSSADAFKTPYVPLDQPTEMYEVTNVSPQSLAKQKMHVCTEMVVEEEMYDEVIIEGEEKSTQDYHTDLSVQDNRLHAVETSVTDQDTKLTADICEIPVEGSQPRWVQQIQQECEKPGPYVPVTGSASSSDLSQDKFILDFSAQSQEASEDPSSVVCVAERVESSMISLGDAYSIHHHKHEIIDGYPDTNDEMLLNNEERADILKKALKPLPVATGIDFDTQMQQMDKIEFEHDRVDDTEPRDNTNSVSDTESYEIPMTISLPPEINEKTSQQKIHLESPLFRRRANIISHELSEKVPDDANNNDHAIRLSEAVQESALQVASARAEIDSDKENRTGKSKLPAISSGDEINSDTECRTGEFFVSHGQDQSEVDNQESSFPWMHSMIFIGTATVAALAYRSLKD